MISYIKGKVIEKTPVLTVLECSNVAFEIRTPLSTYEKLPLSGKEVKLYIHFNVSDDEVRLYGFISIQEKDLFKLLISVNGIGPKLALSVLSSINWQTFIKHIRTEDEKALTIVPGLGKKTAQRLILELKDKIEKMDSITLPENIESGRLNLFKEAETALLTLGYKLGDIRSALDELKTHRDVTTSEQLIKLVIKKMYQKR